MKKQIIAAAAAAMICVGAIGGTFAYLTSGPATVTNTFTVGNGVNFTDPDDELAGGLDEARVNNLGEEITGEKRVAANEYKLIPGHNYKKDPTVHIAAGSDECYVFIKVENGIEAIEAKDDSTTKTVATQIKERWTPVTDKPGYYYWTAGTIKTNEDQRTDLIVFENFTVDSAKTQGDLEKVKDNKIVIKACAVQADGFDTAVDAVDAWPEGFKPASTTTPETPEETPAVTE